MTTATRHDVRSAMLRSAKLLREVAYPNSTLNGALILADCATLEASADIISNAIDLLGEIAEAPYAGMWQDRALSILANMKGGFEVSE